MAQRPQGPDFKAQAQAARADIERQLHESRAQFDQARQQFDQVNEKIRARTGRDLILAVAIGVGAGALLLASLIFVTELFMLFAAAAVALGVVELGTALRVSGRDIPRTASVIAAVALVPASYYLGPDWRWIVTLAGMAFVVLWRLVEYAWPSRRGGGDALLRDLAGSILIQAYVAVLASFAVLLTSPTSSPYGTWWMLAMLIVVVATDTGAYAAGLNFGRHKMAPTISPGKTWEGFAGAALAAILAGILLSVFMLHVPWWFGFVFGVVLLLTATIGDLAESLIKRDIGVKDMSGWLPGHGGVLDRLDSILPSAAAAYALYLIFYPLFS
ncbi:MAG TPA: phosphatidate cytidylyltransferase [Gryllotalpicola sp.]